VGRVLDALLGRDVAAARAARPPSAAVHAAAGRVALAQRGPTARLPLAVGGENLVPVTPFTDPYSTLWGRDAAMSLPTVKRARDLICTAVGALPITGWTIDYSAAPAVEQQVPIRSWMQRPDPSRTRQWMLAWTVDDLFFYGCAHWQIRDRYADTFPSRFERVLPGDLMVDERTGTVTVTGSEVDPVDVVEFLSPIDGLLDAGYRAVSIALQLDDAADRFAGTEVPAGWLQEQDGGEDLSSSELAEQARTFAQARRENTTAAVGKYFRYEEASYDASRMQLVEGRTYQALELARLGNVPPYLVGAPAGTGMTYLNAEQAKADLIDFGALPYIGTIEQTLSGPNVLPRGNFVRLDLNAWLRNPFTTTGPAGTAEPSPNDMQVAFNPPGAPA
jgi:hypothetical protein